MDRDQYYGYLIRGDLQGARNYLKQFPEGEPLYNRFLSIFEQEAYITYPVNGALNNILAVYQRYYREVFYLRLQKEEAAANLRNRLAVWLGVTDSKLELSELEQNQLVELFQASGLHFLGGKTSGYYGPYVWKTTETVSFEVELPDGLQKYTVKMLDGFLTRGWIDFLSFGELGTGGWADGDGCINCVKSAWDIGSEAFQVSLLKHEAQHVRDLGRYKDLSSEDLEYRAKLVELIYSSERNLLGQLARDAGDSDPENGHALAASRIIRGFADMLGAHALSSLGIAQIQSTALEMFRRDSKERDN